MKSKILVGITIMLMLVLPASASDYTLGVFGNANGDDKINMQDVTFTELIILEYQDATELADAKYDGEIDILDVTQIELIILEKEKEITVNQYIGSPPDITKEPVTIGMPIERIITLSGYATEAICVFGMKENIVGVDSYADKMGEIAQLIKDKEKVGSGMEPDVEKIIGLEPDIVIGYTLLSWYVPDTYKVMKDQLESAGIPLILIDFYVPAKYNEEFGVMGQLLRQQDRAQELMDFEEEVLTRINDVVSGIPESEKPRVCYSPHYEYREQEIGIAPGKTESDNRVREAGGINVFADQEGYETAWVSSEAVIEKNPDIILKDIYTGWEGFVECGYNAQDSSSLEQARDLITSRTGWEYITAVENGDVYLLCTHANSIHPCIFGSYMAKWFHPDKFEEMDPISIHEEWLDQFLGIEYKGVYAYPTPWTET